MDGMRHRFRIALLAAAVFAVSAMAAYGKDGKVEFSAYLEGSWVFPVGLAIYPGAELSIYTFTIHNDLNLTLGAALTGQVAFAKWQTDPSWSYTTFGAAVAPSAVFFWDDGSRSIDRLIERFEFGVAPGFGVNYYLYSGDPAVILDRDAFDFGFAGILSSRFRIGGSILLRVDVTYWGRYIGPNLAVGVQLEI